MTAPPHALRLQVARARPDDANRGAARLGEDVLGSLGVAEGDAIAIAGSRTTAAIALRLPFEDRGLRLLRIDGLQRANAGAGLGDSVEVWRVDAVVAERVELAPVDPAIAPWGSMEALRRTLLRRAVITGDVIATSAFREEGAQDAADPLRTLPSFGLQEVRLRVVSTAPAGIVRIGDETVIDLIAGTETSEPAVRPAGVTYDDLGGLGPAIELVREMIELPLKHPELFRWLGIDPPKGILLHGPPGTGKTLLAKAVANEAAAGFFYIDGPEIIGPYQGESEQRLREVFEQARQKAPAIIFMDEIDSIATKRETVRGETERRLVAQLLTLMDGLEPRRNVIVIGATNLVDTLDEALRRPGRFDREIAVGIPDVEGRREILAIHTRGMPLALDVELGELARTTHGFVGADLAALVREAAMDALRRNVSRVELADDQIPAQVLEQITVTASDFANARKRIQPSAMREIMIQVPTVRWDDIGGMEEAKERLHDGIQLPLRHPEAFRRLGLRPVRGFLLFGPPGTGKTLLAKAVAHEAEANFIAVRASDLLSKWYGESERQIARLFARARQVSPSVIFFDEIDSLAPARSAASGEANVTDRIVSTLLAEMDGLDSLPGVVVIGATNRPTLLDPALLRPGRFDELLYVPVPNRDARLRILEIQTANIPLADDVKLDVLADRTARFTGADLEGLVRRAGLTAFGESQEVREVGMAYFERALARSRASVSEEMEREYAKMLDELRIESPRGRRIGFGTAAETADGSGGPPPIDER
jgi:transitional endoplasmic reticulum ATPase